MRSSVYCCSVFKLMILDPFISECLFNVGDDFLYVQGSFFSFCIHVMIISIVQFILFTAHLHKKCRFNYC